MTKRKKQLCAAIAERLRQNFKQFAREIWSDYISLEDGEFLLNNLKNFGYEIAHLKYEEDRKTKTQAAREVIYSGDSIYKKYIAELDAEIGLLNSHLIFLSAQQRTDPKEIEIFENEHAALTKRIGYAKNLLQSVKEKEAADMKTRGRKPGSKDKKPRKKPKKDTATDEGDPEDALQSISDTKGGELSV